MRFLKLFVGLLTLPLALVVGAILSPLMYCVDRWEAFLGAYFYTAPKAVPVVATKKVKTIKKKKVK